MNELRPLPRISGDGIPFAEVPKCPHCDAIEGALHRLGCRVRLAAAMTEADMSTLRLLVADAIDCRREHEDAGCSDCDQGDCETARRDGERMSAYLEFRERLGLRGDL